MNKLNEDYIMFDQALQSIINSVSSVANISPEEFTEILSNDCETVWKNSSAMAIITAVFEPNRNYEVLDFMSDADNDTLRSLAANSPDELKPYIKGAIEFVIENGY